jgi:hypothetical protein
MKDFKWWLKQGVVYGLAAATGIGLMWNVNDWSAARISWLFGGVSIVSLIVGADLYIRAKRPVQR